jgi:hypothetical protein
MAGPRTLKVVRFLAEVGIDAWTPQAMQRQKRPRSTKYRDVPAAALPTFAFADYDQLDQLLQIQHSPVSDHPAFTVFQYRGTIPHVEGAELEPLKQHEHRLADEWRDFCAAEERAALDRRRKKKTKNRRGRSNPSRAYVLGQRVTVLDPAFEGLKATVLETPRNGHLVLDFGGLLQIRVEACDVAPDSVHADELKPAKAARAA